MQKLEMAFVEVLTTSAMIALYLAAVFAADVNVKHLYGEASKAKSKTAKDQNETGKYAE